MRLPMLRRSLLAGIRGASVASQYILCLDDDVLLHPGLLAALVRDMEADSSLFMATGGTGGRAGKQAGEGAVGSMLAVCWRGDAGESGDKGMPLCVKPIPMDVLWNTDCCQGLQHPHAHPPTHAQPQPQHCCLPCRWACRLPL